jgi:asparagine synthase (glutamine-hydrolysing)
VFLFGSELKSLAVHPNFRREINREALTLFMRHAYVPAPFSIYSGIRKLAPGSILTLEAGRKEPSIQTYWSGAEAARKGALVPKGANPIEYVDGLEHVLSTAVRDQMISDVPLGAFLSGGVDSSAVVSLMQANSPRPIRTFSIGFHEEAYNEATHAKAVARHLGTDHTELYVTADEAMSVVPQLPSVYDEPFADSSQIPTLLVSRLARQHVTVSLSGDAGDELFAGYNRYKMTDAYWRRLSRIPRPLRAGLARAVAALSPASWDRIASALRPVFPASARMSLPGEKIIKAAGVLPSASAGELYQRLVSIWPNPAALVLGGNQAGAAGGAHDADLSALSEIERMMALDMLTYLPDDILVKVDRAAMSVSLETRVPFLDHRVVEFAWAMPMDVKLRHGETKWALRQLLYRHVPRELIERPKMGFGVPIDSWLRGPLKGWAEDMLDESRLRREGYLDPEPIRRAWTEHQSGRANRQHQLWAVLMFEAWLAESVPEALTSARSAPLAVASDPEPAVAKRTVAT